MNWPTPSPRKKTIGEPGSWIRFDLCSSSLSVDLTFQIHGVLFLIISYVDDKTNTEALNINVSMCFPLNTKPYVSEAN